MVSVPLLVVHTYCACPVTGNSHTISDNGSNRFAHSNRFRKMFMSKQNGRRPLLWLFPLIRRDYIRRQLTCREKCLGRSSVPTAAASTASCTVLIEFEFGQKIEFEFGQKNGK